MEPETREPHKLIPCELCGSEAKLLCFCRKCSLCENCIGKHLINEPTLAHKPVTFSQNEISALYEQEFTQIREHERRLLQEVSERQEVIKSEKGRLLEEIQKLETFKCTCLEYVAVAVEMTKQKLAQAAESVGKEIVEQCEEKRLILEEGLRALEAGESHWTTDLLERQKDQAVLWQGHIDVKEISLESVLKCGIEFQLTMKKPEIAEVPKTDSTPKRVKEKAVPQKPIRKASVKAVPPTPTIKPKIELARLTQSQNVQKPAGKTLSRTKTMEPEAARTTKRSAALKVHQGYVEGDATPTRKDYDHPSPDPPLALLRCNTDSPVSSSTSRFGFGRAALIQQTEKNVTEMTDMLKTLKSPKNAEIGNLPLTHRMRIPMPLGDLNMTPSDSPVAKSMRHLGAATGRYEFADDPEPEHSLQPSARNSIYGLPEPIPEEVEKLTACLYLLSPGSTYMAIHDVETGSSTVKTFDGIDAFPKLTFWCTVPSGEVFIIGGVGNEAQPSSIKKTCLIYSPAYDTIEPGPSLLTCRHSCAAVYFKGCIFVSGGIGSELSAIKDCERLDLREKKWKRVANMNVPRESHGMTVHAGRIYVAGAPGEQSLEVYNPVNDRWALLHFKVNAGGKACLFSLGDKIAILHDKALTYAWVDKRTSEHGKDVEEKGWWLGGLPVKLGDCFYFLRTGAVFQFHTDSGEIRKTDSIDVERFRKAVNS